MENLKNTEKNKDMEHNPNIQESNQSKKKEINAWQVKVEIIRKEAKIVFRKFIGDTTRLRNDLSEVEMCTNVERGDFPEMNKCSHVLDNLLSRCIPNGRNEKVYSIAFDKAQKEWLRCYNDAYQPIRSEKGQDGIQLDRKATMINKFVQWWKQYLKNDVDAFMGKSIEIALDWLNLWLCHRAIVNTDDELTNTALSQELEKHFNEFSQISTTLFDDSREMLVQSILNELNPKKWTIDTIIEHCFDEEDYVDKDQVVHELSALVDDCMVHYAKHANIMKAPCIALCQSAGFGKSRLMIELSKCRPIIYVSLQNACLGYPKRTPLLPTLLFRNNEVNQDVLKKIATICLSYFDEHNRSPGHKDAVEKYFNVNRGEYLLKKPNKVLAKFDCEEFDRDRDSVRNQHAILVIDEARELLKLDQNEQSLISKLRDTLASIWKQTGIFGIFVDSQSEISHFTPPLQKEFSNGKKLDDAVHLYPPYILRKTFNSMKGVEFKTDIFKSARYIEQFATEEHQNNWKCDASLRRLGRPLWKVSTVNNVVKELLGATYYRGAVPKFNASLAALLARIGGTFSSSSDIGADLVANHMATLIDSTNDHTLVGYISDPFMAYCAKKLWQDQDMLVCHFIPALRMALMQGVVMNVYLGEMVARILLLHVLDNMKPIANGEGGESWFNVKSYLKMLVGEYSDFPTIPKNAKLCFYHFISFVNDVNPSDLHWLMLRRAAAVLQVNQHGADILIPYWYQKDGETETLVSYIIVQVKNWESGCVDRNEVAKELQPCSVFQENTKFLVLPTDTVVGIVFCLYCTKKRQAKCSIDASRITEAQTAPNVKSLKMERIPVFWSCGLTLDTKIVSDGVRAGLQLLLEDSITLKHWHALQKGFTKNPSFPPPSDCPKLECKNFDKIALEQLDSKERDQQSHLKYNV